MHVKFSFDVIYLEFWILQLNKTEVQIGHNLKSGWAAESGPQMHRVVLDVHCIGLLTMPWLSKSSSCMNLCLACLLQLGLVVLPLVAGKQKSCARKKVLAGSVSFPCYRRLPDDSRSHRRIRWLSSPPVASVSPVSFECQGSGGCCTYPLQLEYI